MATFLFDDIIFGPVKSRRLGDSLGINLLPNDKKLCNFDCIYCECGWTDDMRTIRNAFHPADTVIAQLEETLKFMHHRGANLDVITYAGNGEPTMHPDFAFIADESIRLRNRYFPFAKIAVLSNGTMLHKSPVFQVLTRVDQNIQKLDSVFQETVQLINQPLGKFDVQKAIAHYKAFQGHVIIQTLFVRGTYQGKTVDNATEQEIEAWLKTLKSIAPQSVMVYTIARDTPAKNLVKVPAEELEAIAQRVREAGMHVSVAS